MGSSSSSCSSTWVAKWFLLMSLFCLCSLLQGHQAKQGDLLRKLINKSRHANGPTGEKKPMLYEESLEEMEEEALISTTQYGSMEEDKVHKLPGQPDVGVAFDQYAGYVKVDEKAGRALFYYFVESPHDPSSKPLLLWLNGGPGCSSLGFGAMTELGPFRVNSDNRTLFSNPYAWNRVANVLFLETPAGVGFSYSNTSRDYKRSGDKRTARDSYTFLVNWMERFPHYKNREFFIAGESYAGHYVPQLAMTIIRRNGERTNGAIINLRGIAIGNAYMDGMTGRFDTNTMGGYEYLWSHAIISSECYRGLRRECKYPNGRLTKACEKAMDKAEKEAGNIDNYNIYAPICTAGSSAKNASAASVYQLDPCIDDYVNVYLNLPEVRKALHVKTSRKWTSCSDLSWTDAASTAVPILKQVIQSGTRTWLYSGDTDSVVPVTASRYYIDMLKLEVKRPWRPWYAKDDEVGGYVEEFEGLTFATVRGAGHEVPSYQPARSLTMITAFLKGKPLK